MKANCDVSNDLYHLNDDNINPIIKQLKQDFHSVEYSDIITYYYDVIVKRSLKCGYHVNKGFSYLRKLDEWESNYWDIQEIGA